MIHGINRQFLYSAVKIDAAFESASVQKSKNISGTAFFAKINGCIALITNRHVLDLLCKNPRFLDFKLTGISLTGRFSADNLVQCAILHPFEVKFHPDDQNDVALIKCDGLKFVSKTDLRVDNFIPEALIARSEDFDRDIGVCDFVAFPGYPDWHDQVEVRPIFRVGTIASDPSKNYHYGIGETAVAGDCVAYEAFSYGGSSGSPVFALQKGFPPGPGIKFDACRSVKSVGINGGHLPSSDTAHSGMSYFYKSSVLFGML